MRWETNVNLLETVRMIITWYNEMGIFPRIKFKNFQRNDAYSLQIHIMSVLFYGMHSNRGIYLVLQVCPVR